MPYRYPSEFRRRVLDLLATGRSVASLSEDPGVSDQTIYNWRRQDLIDRGVEPGSTSAEQAELRAARRRIRELETELAVTKRAIEFLKGKVVSPKTLRGDPDDENRGPIHPGGVPSAGSVRVGVLRLEVPPPFGPVYPPAWLTDIICQVHQQSRGIYGARRVHAELTLGHGITVGHNAVTMLMPRSRPSWSQWKPPAQTAPPPRGHPSRPGRQKLRPLQTRPAMGHRHRAPRGVF